MTSVPAQVTHGAVAPDRLLGQPTPRDDWKLEPSAHAARLDDKAVTLKRVLEDEAIGEIMRRYERHDALAIDQQNIYKKYGRLEIYLGTTAAILGGIVLSMTDPQFLTPPYDALRVGFLLTQIVCAAAVMGLKFLLQRRKPFVKWQELRSQAETARIELFETVCGLTERKWTDAHQPGDYPLLPLQLAYFVRYQLMVQVLYYDQRGAEHAKAANQYVSFGAIVIFFAALCAALVGLGQELGDSVSIAAMAGLVAPVLLAAQTSLSRLNQDERNAARYAITHAHLDRLRGKLSDIRKDAARGNTQSVHNFIRDVDAVISVEHSEWMTQQSNTLATESTQSTESTESTD